MSSTSPTPNKYPNPNELTWSRSEKAIARAVFDAALKRELHEVMQKTKERANQIREHVGNYVWTELAHAWKSGTRATFGAFQITPNVVAAKQKVGGQFAIEQPIDSRVTFAIDWFTGDSSIGYLTPGVIIKVTRQLSWYATYQLGNHRLTEGNHQFLFELGWNFN